MALTKVSTDGVKDQGVDLTKLPHGTSSNDGKFLRANNGADPTFETVTSTTINNNADNRVITGSGTANTLNAESNVVIDSSGKLLIGTTSSRNVGGSTTNSKLQVEGASQNASSISLTSHENDPKGAFVFFGKTRGGSGGSATIVQNGDTLGGLSFIGADSVDTNNRSAEITAKVDGTPANNTIPTALSFSTSTANANQLAERMRINSSGNVGIGNDASFPVYTHVNSRNFMLGTGGESTALQIHSSSTTYGGIYFGDVADRTDAGSYIGSIEYKHGDDFMNFRTNGSERMRIDSSGNMMINSTITNNGTGNNTAGFCFQPMRLFGSGTGHAPLALNRSNDGIVALWYRGGNLVGNITVGSNSVAYNSTSDYRLKENVSSISDGITRLKTLKPSRFNFISEPSKTIDGFLAHEVTAVPEAISGTKDEIALEDNEDLDIKKGNPIYQTIDQSKLVPLLTAALQEAIAKIEVLETKVAALEAA